MIFFDKLRGMQGMWVRKRIEITPGELIRGLACCALPGPRDGVAASVARFWDARQTVVCLSVRSGFDLLLHSAGWPPGSEVIMSGLTIPDMPRIVEENGLVPVGVDIDLTHMAPDVDEIRRRITPHTRAIVVAHLLGGVCDLGPVRELASEHGLLLIEDCAQAFVGRQYQGDPQADVSMFSFGPIKTNTALSGGLVLVRDEALRLAMLRCQEQWKLQSRWTFARRIGKYGMVKMLSTRPVCGGIYRMLKMCGRNHDGIASTMARGFAGSGFFLKIRRQPSRPLLQLLDYKLGRWQDRHLERRRQHGQFLQTALGPGVCVLGSQMNRQTWWVFPILVERPDELIPRLWDAGFDASNNCSLHAMLDEQQSVACSVLRHIVFLPLHGDMPKSELTRMARIVRQAEPEWPAFVRSAKRGRDVEPQPVSAAPLPPPCDPAASAAVTSQGNVPAETPLAR